MTMLAERVLKAKNFGQYIKKIRKEKKLTLQEMELLSGVSNAYLSQIETGKRSIPSPEIMAKLFRPLGVTYEELMDAGGYLEPMEYTDNEDLKQFGLFVATSREKSGYNSQRQLALASGISNGTIARIEAGTQKAIPDTLKTLSKHLKGVTYEELMSKSGYLDKPNFGNIDYVVEDWINEIINASDKQREAMKTIWHSIKQLN